tara:strand:- start:1079 stop:1288 length:210 start_codon:yes stop_codon:yes gene_type:complete
MFGKLGFYIDTASGVCPHCEESTLLIAVVSEFYRCTVCGEDTKQHINGEIKYLKLTKDDTEWLKNRNLE